MKRSTAKILRAIILAGWTIAAVVLVIVIQNAGNTIMLQKTVSSVLVVYVCLSPAVCGIVFRLSTIINQVLFPLMKRGLFTNFQSVQRMISTFMTLDENAADRLTLRGISSTMKTQS